MKSCGLGNNDPRLIVIDMKLGKTEFSLNVKSLAKSREFYASLGFEEVEGAGAEGWLVLEKSGLRIGLYQGHIPENALTFFGGDVAAIAAHLTEAGYEMTSGPEKEADGSLGATVKDPDGNLIYFNS